MSMEIVKQEKYALAMDLAGDLALIQASSYKEDGIDTDFRFNEYGEMYMVKWHCMHGKDA